MSRREFLETLTMASVAFMVGCTKPSSEQEQSKVVAQIKPEDYVMTNKEAETYVKEKIHPRLEKLIQDPRNPEGIKSRIIQLFTKIQKREIEYYALPAFHPISKKIVAKLDYDIKSDKTELIVFVPVLQERLTELRKAGFSEDEQSLDIGIIFSHEYIHEEQESRHPQFHELAGKANDPEFAILEAEAWGLTVTELIRPAVKNGLKVAHELQLASDAYAKMGDDWHDPRWMRIFDPNRKD